MLNFIFMSVYEIENNKIIKKTFLIVSLFFQRSTVFCFYTELSFLTNVNNKAQVLIDIYITRYANENICNNEKRLEKRTF